MNIFLVRHGEAAAGWGQSADPGLSELGQQQARGAGDRLVALLGDSTPVDLISSPLLRAQETAIPLAESRGQQVVINDAFREVPSPVPFEERQAWLRQFMQEDWGTQPALLTDWRENTLAALKALPNTTVIFTHFMILNAVVGALTGQDAVLCFKPDNGSITQLALEGGELRLVAQGDELQTFVN